MASKPRSEVSAFALFVQGHGKTLKGMEGKPGSGTVIALSAHPGKVAPNSPLIPLVAKWLGADVEQVRSFAKGPPMPEKWVNKITQQLANGNLGAPKNRKINKERAKKGAAPQLGIRIDQAKGRTGAFSATTGKPSPLQKYLAVVGPPRDIHSFADLARVAGIRQDMLWRLRLGTVAKNHPGLTLIAKALNVSVPELAKFAKLRPLAIGQLKRVQGALDKIAHRKTGKAMVHVPKVEHHNGNGKLPMPLLAHVDAATVQRRGGWKHNKLKGKDVRLRQVARALAMTLNLGVMKGETHMPPLPLDDMRLVLDDWFEQNGIKQVVLLGDSFTSAFDED